MNKVFGMISLILDKMKTVEDTDMKIPEGWKILKNVDFFDHEHFLIEVQSFGDDSSFISKSDLMEKFVDNNSLGLKNLNYFFANKHLIPEECKEKTVLFLGTICKDDEERIWTPKLYYLPFHNQWRMSFFCLSVDRVSCKHDVALIALDTTNT